MSELSKLTHFSEINASIPLKFVYTPIHGVGQPYAERAFATFKFPPFISVKKQSAPDPEFPTVKYPNPEEGKASTYRRGGPWGPGPPLSQKIPGEGYR
jgi:phosphomannomutase